MEKRLREDLKESMKQKNELKKNTIKMVLDKSTQKAKENKVQLSDSIINDVLMKELKDLKSLREELESLKQTDSSYYEETVNRISIVEEYLPKFLDDEEINTLLDQYISEGNQEGIEGKRLIGYVMKKFSDKPVDKKKVNSLLQAKL